MTMAWTSEAMCRVRRRERQRVTVQPSTTQTHQSRCRNRTVSTRTDAERMRPYLALLLSNNCPMAFQPDSWHHLSL